MKIYVPMICSKVPRHVQAIQGKNQLLTNNRFEYYVMKEPYEKKKHGFAGLDVEAKKARLLLSCDNVMVIDWDVELLGFANDLPPGLHCGSWKSNNIDGFLIYKKGNDFDYLINDYLAFFEKNREYWQVFLDSKINNDKNIYRYPKELYVHYSFGFGRSVRCIDTMDDKAIDGITRKKMGLC